MVFFFSRRLGRRQHADDDERALFSLPPLPLFSLTLATSTMASLIILVKGGCVFTKERAGRLALVIFALLAVVGRKEEGEAVKGQGKERENL